MRTLGLEGKIQNGHRVSGERLLGFLMNTQYADMLVSKGIGTAADLVEFAKEEN